MSEIQQIIETAFLKPCWKYPQPMPMRKYVMPVNEVLAMLDRRKSPWLPEKTMVSAVV